MVKLGRRGSLSGVVKLGERGVFAWENCSVWRTSEVGTLCAELCQSLACRFDMVCTLSPGKKGESSDEENDEKCEAG